MKRILFYYFNLEHKEKYAYGILKTNVEISVIQTLMFTEEKTLKEVLEIIDKKDKNAVFVRTKKLSLKNCLKNIPVDTIYDLSTNKYITLEAI